MMNTVCILYYFKRKNIYYNITQKFDYFYAFCSFVYTKIRTYDRNVSKYTYVCTYIFINNGFIGKFICSYMYVCMYVKITIFLL